MNRIIWIVIDSVGVGALPDAKAFGDEGVNTLGHIVKEFNDIKIPNMVKLGLGNIDGIDYIKNVDSPIGSFGRCNEVSQGKDTTTGHWEMTGLLVDTPFKTFENGFPKEIIDEFERRTGRKVVALFMRFFVKLYFKLDKESYCYCIGTKGDNDDFDIHRREYKND